MTYFDVRIPGLKMTVVAADGLNVHPVTVGEFRIAVAETFDGVTFSNAAPIRLTYGERLRIVLVNDTMMTHPIHGGCRRCHGSRCFERP